jgi:hypothetical protein
VERIRHGRGWIGHCDGKLAAHTWRAASASATWAAGRWRAALFFLNVLTGSVGNLGGTAGNAGTSSCPSPSRIRPPSTPGTNCTCPTNIPLPTTNELPAAPLSGEEGRGEIDVYFTRVYNPMWINPDGFMWLKALRDEEQIKCHVALTPTWNESAWFADYVLPMGHAGERHDLMSQETHAGQWIAFRQPVRRVAMEKLGKPVQYTYEANPGEVWEENELWVELSVRMDPDGSLGVRQWFESPYRPGEIITVDEYYRGSSRTACPVCPRRRGRRAHAAGLHAQVRRFEVKARQLRAVRAAGLRAPIRWRWTQAGPSPISKEKTQGRVGVLVDGKAKRFRHPQPQAGILQPHAAPIGAGRNENTPSPGRSKATSIPITSTAARGKCCCCPTSACPR